MIGSPNTDPPFLDDHDGTIPQLRLDRWQVRQQQRSLLLGSALRLPVEQHDGRLYYMTCGQQIAEVGVGRHDHARIPDCKLEDVGIRCIQARHLTDVDRIVSGFAQLLHDHR
jgi:hypothetical protein